MEIVSGYNRKCKDSQGGVKAVWLLKWQKYNRSQIVIENNYLVDFPEEFVFKFESLTMPNANETMQENEGGKFYEQSISLTIRTEDKHEISKLQNNDYRVLFLDNNGLYRIFGLYNGAQVGNIDFKTGGAKGDLNGFTFTFTAQEERQSVFYDFDAEQETFYILTENGDIINAENNDRLIYQ